ARPPRQTGQARIGHATRRSDRRRDGRRVGSGLGTPGRGGGGVPASQFQPATGGGPAAVLLVGASAGDDERLDEGEFRQLVLAQSGVERGGGAPVAAVLLYPPVGGGARPAAEETH